MKKRPLNLGGSGPPQYVDDSRLAEASDDYHL